MKRCKICGRELKENEMCGCTLYDYRTKEEYIKLSVSKETVNNIKKFPQNLAETLSEINDDTDIRTVDGEYENELNIVDECIVPTEREIPVRQYRIARLSTPLLKKAYGRLQVTNKRVIFRAAGKSIVGQIITEKEFAVEEISGIEIKTDYRFSFVVLIISIIEIIVMIAALLLLFGSVIKFCDDNFSGVLTLLSIMYAIVAVFLSLVLSHKRALKAALFGATSGTFILLSMLSDSNENTPFMILLAILFGVISLVLSFLSGIVDDLHLIIKIKGASEAIDVSRKLFKDERSGFMLVKPWKDTLLAIQELGALINDIKQLGDNAIRKWDI